MIDIRCSRDDFKCGGCPIMKECEHIGLTEEIDVYYLYEKGRTDAIDEFMNKALAMIKAEHDTRYGYLDCMDIREIAEQLRGELK